MADLPGNDFPLQDYIILGAHKSPGVCKIRGAGTPRKWDIRQGYGLSGASTIFVGNELSQFEVDFTIWDPVQMQDWITLARLYLDKEPLGGRPKAIGIRHPLLTTPPLKITSVVVLDVTQFDPDENGALSCTIKFLEYRAPKPMLGKPLAAIPAAAKAVPTAKDAADAEIKAKLETLKGLANAP